MKSLKQKMPELIVLVLLCALPAWGESYLLDLAAKIIIFSTLAIGLELLVGTAGIVSLGHAAFFGLGAYGTWALAKYGVTSLLLLLAGSALLAGLYALATGMLALRTKGVYFLMVTLAFAQMAYFVIHDTGLGGGSDGVYLTNRPGFSIGTISILDLDKTSDMYWLCLMAMISVYAVLTLILRAPFGHALHGIRVNEQRMRACGYATYEYKLAAFVLAGMSAGIAGSLMALREGFVNPELLSWHLSGQVLVMIILGGIGSLRGAFVGAAAFVLLQELFRYEPIFGKLASSWQLSLSIVIILCVAFLPNGLIGLLNSLSKRLTTSKDANRKLGVRV